MATDTYSDLVVVHTYMNEIATFIQKIIEDENVATIMACQVFEGHKKMQDRKPFESEKDRQCWLYLISRNLAIEYLRGKRNEQIKAEALGAAIHDCP